jgi:hypothetical protein
MCKCCKDADWREKAVKTCSVKIQDKSALHPDFVDKSDKSEYINCLLSGTWCKVSPDKGTYALPANRSFYYSVIKNLLRQVENHHLELTCYKKIEFALSMTHSNGYGHFANYCISELEHGNLPTEPLMKVFHK